MTRPACPQTCKKLAVQNKHIQTHLLDVLTGNQVANFIPVAQCLSMRVSVWRDEQPVMMRLHNIWRCVCVRRWSHANMVTRDLSHTHTKHRTLAFYSITVKSVSLWGPASNIVFTSGCVEGNFDPTMIHKHEHIYLWLNCKSLAENSSVGHMISARFFVLHATNWRCTSEQDDVLGQIILQDLFINSQHATDTGCVAVSQQVWLCRRERTQRRD